MLKLLLPAFREDPAFERMFVREAAAYTSRLNHPAIVRLYEFFSDDGQLSMVLEFVDGIALHKLRAMLKQRGEEARRSGRSLARLTHRLGAGGGARARAILASGAVRARHPSRRKPVEHPASLPWDGHVQARRLRDREDHRNARRHRERLHQRDVRPTWRPSR